MNISISMEDFINPQANRDSFNFLFNKAVREKKAVQFDFSNEQIGIKISGASQDFCVVLKAKYIFQKINLETVSAYGLFLPFLVNFSSITIGSQYFFYYPNQYRSIMNILARNFSINLLSGFNSWNFIFDKKYSSRQNIILSEEISKNIFWEIRNSFKRLSYEEKLNFYLFKFAPLMGDDFFNVEILNKISNIVSNSIFLEYESDHAKKEVRTLLSFRDDILNLKSKLR